MLSIPREAEKDAKEGQMRLFRVPNILTYVLLLLLLKAQGQAGAQKTPDPDPFAQPETRITVGCTLYLEVAEEPELSHAYEIDAKGSLAFKVGEGTDEKSLRRWTVKVLDRSVGEARNLIVDSLKRYVISPTVRLTLTHIPRLSVEVRGAVKSPGKRELRLKSRLADVFEQITPADNADLGKVTLIHRSPADPNNKTPRQIAFDYTAYLNGEVKDTPLLEQNDLIKIGQIVEEKPRPPLEVVEVIGEVQQQGSVPYSPTLTIRDALRRVGGLKPTAKRDKILRIRLSNRKKYYVDSDKAEAGDPLHNQVLEAGDTIIVETRDQSLIFAVSGEVNQPKTFEWKPTERVTLTEAIKMVGGVTRTADRRKGVIRRGYLRNPTLSHPLYFDLDLIAAKKQVDWEIEAGDDILILPRQRAPSFGSLLPAILRLLPFGL